MFLWCRCYGAAVVSADAYSFLAFSDLSPWGYRNRCFSGCTVPPDSKETKLGSSDQEASPSADKNTGILFVPCRAWKCIPTAISDGVNISQILGCYLLQQISSQ